MNQQRLVAAIAALAIGFAVTLVGVGVADDEIAADPSESEQEVGAPNGEDEASDDDQRAEQEEEIADEPEAAEAEEPSPPATEPSTQQGQPVPAPTSAPVPTNAPNTTSAPDGNQGEPGSDRPFPNEGFECRTVLRLDYTEETKFAVVIEQFGDRQFLILDSDGESEIDLDDEQGLEGAGILARIVQIENGRLISIEDPCDLEDDAPGGGIGGEVDGEASISGEVFPCSERAFDGLLRGLSNLERTELIDHRDIFVAVIAKGLASVGSTDEDTWVAALDNEFDSFADIPDGCSEEIEAAFVGNGTGFFCAAAQISSDDDLFRFFQEAVGREMVGCTFEDESAQGGT